MGARPDRSSGALECCGRLLAFVFFLVCTCLVMAMVATDGGASLASSSSLNAETSAAAAMATGGSAPAWRSGGRGGMADADAFRSSKRRIPKGPDPIHNRYVDG